MRDMEDIEEGMMVVLGLLLSHLKTLIWPIQTPP